MGLVGFQCSPRGDEKLLLEKENFSIKVNISLKPWIFLVSENVNIENEGSASKTFLNF